MIAANLAKTGASGLLVGLSLLGAPRCLILTDPAPSSPCPPTIVVLPAVSPLPDPSTVWYYVPGDGGTAKFTGTLLVNTCDVTPLQVREFVDGSFIGSLETSITPTQPNVPVDYTFSVDISWLPAGCHSIEILVSSAFSAYDPSQPATAGNVAEIAWLVDYNPVGDAGSPPILTATGNAKLPAN